MVTFPIATALFVGLDVAWFKLVSGGFFFAQMGPLARAKDGEFDLVLWAALGAYLLLGAGTTWLVDPLAQDSWLRAAARGALFGLVVYGVYDTTNHATLKHWPVQLMVVDVAWGVASSAIVAGLVWAVGKKWLVG